MYFGLRLIRPLRDWLGRLNINSVTGGCHCGLFRREHRLEYKIDTTALQHIFRSSETEYDIPGSRHSHTRFQAPPLHPMRFKHLSSCLDVELLRHIVIIWYQSAIAGGAGACKRKKERIWSVVEAFILSDSVRSEILHLHRDRTNGASNTTGRHLPRGSDMFDGAYKIPASIKPRQKERVSHWHPPILSKYDSGGRKAIQRGI